MNLDSLKNQYHRLKADQDSLAKHLDKTQMTEELSGSLALEKTARIDKDIIFITNLASVLKSIREQATQGNLSNDRILALHKTLLLDDAGVAGCFRHQRGRINSFDVPAPEHLPLMMKEAILSYYSQDSRPFLERIARFHLTFHEIQPFDYGSGHLGRALINYQLIELGHPPIAIHKTDRAAYFACFDEMDSSTRLRMMIKLLRLRLNLNESLNRYIAHFSGKKIIPLVSHAMQTKQPKNAILNKAKRQTIPAFREDGRWMIGVEFGL